MGLNIMVNIWNIEIEIEIEIFDNWNISFEGWEKIQKVFQ